MAETKTKEEMLQWLLENFFTWDMVELPYGEDDEEDEVFGGWYTQYVGDHNALEVQHDTLGYIEESDFKRARNLNKVQFKGINVTVSINEGDNETFTFNRESEKNAFLIGLDVSKVPYEVIKGEENGG